MGIRARQVPLQQLGLLAALWLALLAPVNAVRADTVRVAYLIPNNRTAQTDGVTNLRAGMLSIQSWYAEQMERWGYGAKTFNLEMEADGVTPKIHLTNLNVDDAHLRASAWSNTLNAAQDAGITVWGEGETWVLFSEAHVQNPDGSIDGGAFLGAPWGVRYSGTALIGGDAIFRMNPANLADTTPYHGQTVPQVGPYPLVQDVSFPWFARDTISSISSGAQGGVAHELGHALWLNHDFINDENFNGNLMGNGLRGLRGALDPEAFPGDDMRLSQAAARALNQMRNFNPGVAYTDSVRPVVDVTTSGAVDPVNGLLEIDFTANDASGLTVALLRQEGHTIDSMDLTGTSFAGTFATSMFQPGLSEDFTVSVYDAEGNMFWETESITVNIGPDRAPQPFVKVANSVVFADRNVTFDASKTDDPDGNDANLTVEWDFDGDGTWDTAPSSTLTVNTTYDVPGVNIVYARLTDEDGHQSISTPIAMRVLAVACDFDEDGDCDWFDVDALTLVGDLPAGVPVSPAVAGFDLNGDNVVDAADLDLWLAAAATENGHATPYRDGDADVDRDVDITDFGHLATNFDPGGIDIGRNGWSRGDFDGDNDVDISDFNVLASNFAPGGYDDTAGTVVDDATPGAVDLIVDVATGEVALDGNGAAISGLQIFSAGDSLLAADFVADVLQFVIATNASTYAEGAFVNTSIDGVIALGLLYDIGVDARDVTFEYTMIGQPTVTGNVTYVPQPASIALLLGSGLLLSRRRRGC